MNNPHTNDLESRLIELVHSSLADLIATRGALGESMTVEATKHIVGTILSYVTGGAQSISQQQTSPATNRAVITNEVALASPRRSWATSRDIRPVVGRYRKPRSNPPLVS